MKKITCTVSMVSLLLAQPVVLAKEPVTKIFSGLNKGSILANTNIDTDGDGIPDWLDDDIDGDGIKNEYELRLGFDPYNPKSTPPDFDGDGIPDALDSDIDGDGVLNEFDAFPYDPLEWSDLDGDGIGDNEDPDIDGDGISNDYEIQLGYDPRDPNSTPPDLDGDGIPDALDDDIDGDGVPNALDAFPYDPKEWSDLDGDGIGDNHDPDIDGDGIANEYEIKLGFDPRDPKSTPPDLDGDGIPDALDHDIDGDGVPNNKDAFPYDPTEWADTDGDGIGDNSDPDIDGDGFSNAEELKAGTDPYDKASFPDREPPVIDFVQWSDNNVLTGMTYDDGMGLKAVWLQSSSSERCQGKFGYSGSFEVNCPQAKNGNWQLFVEDKAGNRAQKSIQ